MNLDEWRMRQNFGAAAAVCCTHYLGSNYMIMRRDFACECAVIFVAVSYRDHNLATKSPLVRKFNLLHRWRQWVTVGANGQVQQVAVMMRQET